MPPKSVCVIGAGPSGLVAAKTFLHNAPAGEFKVTVFDGQDGIGGLWPASKSDTTRQVHPLMVANQSKHTMHFSDHAWEHGAPQLPRAWQVGRYLEAYKERYLSSNQDFSLHLNTRVARTQLLSQGGPAWDVTLESEGKQETRRFDHVVVASGYFGKPVVPDGVSITPSATVPVIHSSQYRDLKSLLGNRPSARGKILIVGGQMSGVEIAGTIAAHLSSATHAPGTSSIGDVDQCSIHHVIQRPIWVLPLHTTAEPKAAAAPFLPLDFSSYNRNNRPLPLVNTQGHLDGKTAQTVHGIFQTALGTDQSVFSPQLHVTEQTKVDPPYLAVSDWYCEFVRSGLISLSTGKCKSLGGNSAAKLTDGTEINDVIAVVLATGFDPSPCISYLPEDILTTLNHSPQHREQPLALAFHGTHHPDVPNLGFVGFYRSPYWGVMQMQARFLAQYWSPSASSSEALRQKLKSDRCIQTTLSLRNDPRLSQFPMGDYPFLMQEFSEALSIPRADPPLAGVPLLSHNRLPLDMMTPSRYPSPSDDAAARGDAERLRRDTVQTAIDGLTTPRFVPRAVFRSLLGTWKLERDLNSRLPAHPSGHFSGTAQFLLRGKTTDGLRCAKQGLELLSDSQGDDSGLEYLYVEDGEFRTNQGFGFRATRRYVWRYDEQRELLSVWFAKPDDPKRADYLFHDIEFLQPSEGRHGGWSAKAGHLCIDDYYDVKYNFAFEAVNLKDWSIEYTVNGPKKDYTISGKYIR